VTTSELAKELFSLVEAKVLSRPTPTEFEMAYQARIAMERIRFAIKLSERARDESGEALEAGIQLLEALNCLESVDRRFQERCRTIHASKSLENGTASKRAAM
jgi:hypothetical protein